MIPAAIGGSSVISGLFGKSAANKAASASRDAALLQQQMYQTTRGDLAPFVQSGAGALPTLNALTYGDPATVQARLEQTPGYQFALQQGLKSTQANAAARGLGVSGASLKGAATYATGLADQTFENRFQDALRTAGLGESAAAMTGQQGTQAAATGGQYTSQAGLANAAGTMAGPNALTSGINSYLGYQMYLDRTGGGTSGYNLPSAAYAGGPYTGPPQPYAPPVAAAYGGPVTG